jgi:hypothetical protein
MYNFKLNPVESPCKDCKKRYVGCHSAENCLDWKTYEDKRNEFNKINNINVVLDDIKYKNISKQRKNYSMPKEKENN